jgi:hypothetical protein
MDALLKKYGGINNLKKHLKLFFINVSEEKRIKHYFFGIDVNNVINDVINYKIFMLPKLEYIYQAFPIQTSPISIKVRIPVFEEVCRVLQKQLQNEMLVNYRDVPRMSHFIMDATEETRCKSMDSGERTSIASNLVSLEAINEILNHRSRAVRTEYEQNGDLKIDRSWRVTYPFYLHLSQENKTFSLYAKGYAREGVDESEIHKILKAAKDKLVHFNLHLKKDAKGLYIEMRHTSDYSADGIPIRLFLVLLLNFSWRFEEVMSLDKELQMIHVLRDKL